MAGSTSEQRQELRKQSKKNGEFAGGWVSDILGGMLDQTDDREEVETKVFVAV